MKSGWRKKYISVRPDVAGPDTSVADVLDVDVCAEQLRQLQQSFSVWCMKDIALDFACRISSDISQQGSVAVCKSH